MHRKEVIELGSTNWLLIGLAAAAVIAIGGFFLIGNQGQVFETAGEASVVGFGAGAFGEPAGSSDCAASCEDEASCRDGDKASCSEDAGACNSLAQSGTCGGSRSGARDGSGRGLGQGQCDGNCEGDCS